MTDRPTPLTCKRAEERDAASWSGAKMGCPHCFLLGVIAAYAAPLVALFFVAPLIEIVWRVWK